ncbi:MAG TPA: PKD domain-containing protein, partial [Candidatus Paceibacterota bacterium]
GEDRTVAVGASVVFEGRATGLTGDPLQNARYAWSFGNGEHKEGASVLYAFSYPGVYVVVLDVSSGSWSATDRATITAAPPDVTISSVTPDAVYIRNRSAVELDLGMWILSVGEKSFTFPKNTIVLGGESIVVSNRVTGLSPTGPPVSLRYPNGTVVGEYRAPSTLARVAAEPQRGSSGIDSPKGDASRSAPFSDVSSEASSASELAAVSSLVEDVPSGGRTSQSGGMLVWVLGVALVAGLGIAALFFVRHGGTRGTSGYTITEDTS